MSISRKSHCLLWQGQGLSVVVVEDSLVAFCGYNGHFKNQVHSLIPLYPFLFHDIRSRMCSENTK